MAWNRASDAPKVAPKKKPSAMRGIVAGLVTVCALGGLCLWMFSGGDDAPKAKPEKERGRIKEVTPAPASTNVVAQEPVKYTNRGHVRRLKIPTYKDENGILRWKGGQRVFDPDNPPDCYVVSAPKSPHLNFEFECENSIAGLLEVEPGDDLVGEIEYGRDFDADFVKAMAKPIAIPEDASDYDKALMREVQGVKEDLAKEVAEGKLPSKVLTEARLELQRLASIRKDLEAQLENVYKSDTYSDDDLNDFVTAANMMLADHGARAIKMPSFVKRNRALQLEGMKPMLKKSKQRVQGQKSAEEEK